MKEVIIRDPLQIKQMKKKFAKKMKKAKNDQPEFQEVIQKLEWYFEELKYMKGIT